MTKYLGARPTEKVIANFGTIVDTLSPTLAEDVAYDMAIIINDTVSPGRVVPESISQETLLNLATYVAGLILLPEATEIALQTIENVALRAVEQTELFLSDLLGDDDEDEEDEGCYCPCRLPGYDGFDRC